MEFTFSIGSWVFIQLLASSLFIPLAVFSHHRPSTYVAQNFFNRMRTGPKQLGYVLFEMKKRECLRGSIEWIVSLLIASLFNVRFCDLLANTNEVVNTSDFLALFALTSVYRLCMQLSMHMNSLSWKKKTMFDPRTGRGWEKESETQRISELSCCRHRSHCCFCCCFFLVVLSKQEFLKRI